MSTPDPHPFSANRAFFLGLGLALLACGEPREPEAPRVVIPVPGEYGLSPGFKRPHSLSLNNPEFVVAREAAFMEPDDLVVGVVVDGRARAYPWFALRNFHIANDTIILEDGDVAPYWQPFARLPSDAEYHVDPFIPLLITMCEACSSASAYIPIVGDSVDRPLVFAQCRSEGPEGGYNAVGTYTMCDLQTHSRWHPFVGRAESGPLAGKRLKRVPVAVESWENWVRRHPETQVLLAGREMRGRTHGKLNIRLMGGSGVHVTYRRAVRANPEREDKRLSRGVLVFGIASRDGKKGLAYPLETLREAGGFVQREFEGEPYLFILRGEYRAAAYHARRGDAELRFTIVSDDPLVFEDASGTRWDELGRAISGARRGERLEIVATSYLTEWSEWSMGHPGSEIVAAAGSSL